MSVFRDPDRTFVYVVQADNGPIKIGCSGDPSTRLKNFQSHSPNIITTLAVTRGGLFLERRLMARWSAHHMHHEWFRADQTILADIENLKISGREHFLTPAEIVLDALGSIYSQARYVGFSSENTAVITRWHQSGIPQATEQEILQKARAA